MSEVDAYVDLPAPGVRLRLVVYRLAQVEKKLLVGGGHDQGDSRQKG
jgi:hypothetical protein